LIFKERIIHFRRAFAGIVRWFICEENERKGFSLGKAWRLLLYSSPYVFCTLFSGYLFI